MGPVPAHIGACITDAGRDHQDTNNIGNEDVEHNNLNPVGSSTGKSGQTHPGFFVNEASVYLLPSHKRPWAVPNVKHSHDPFGSCAQLMAIHDCRFVVTIVTTVIAVAIEIRPSFRFHARLSGNDLLGTAISSHRTSFTRLDWLNSTLNACTRLPIWK